MYILCLQAFLQVYITSFYYSLVRVPSTNQMLSIFQSMFTICTTMLKVWLPQVLGVRQFATTSRPRWWAGNLTGLLFITLMITLNTTGFSRDYYVQVYVLLLDVAICSIFSLHKNCFKKFKQIERLKSCLLSSLFLVKLATDIFFLYKIVNYGSFDYHIPVNVFLVIEMFIVIFIDAFFAYIFGKSFLKSYSISSIWKYDPDIISKQLYWTLFFLTHFWLMWLLSFSFTQFVYSKI